MGDRLFPKISDAFYDQAADAEVGPVVSAVLKASSRPFTAWQRLRARRLPGDGPIALLLGLHRAAFDSERAAFYDRADFYWSEFYRLLPAVWKNDAAWAALVHDSGKTVPLDPAAVRAAVASDIIRDTHVCLYAVHHDNAGNQDRADDHLRRMLGSLKYCTEEERDLAYGDLTAGAVRDRLAADQFDAAYALSSALLNHFPRDAKSQALHIHVVFKGAAAAAGDEKAAKARRLQRTIDQMNAWRSTFEDHTDLYDALGVLYLLHAVATANAGEVSAALLDVAKAEVADPGLRDIAPLKQRLGQLMHDLQHKMSAIDANLAANPSARLSADGYRLRAETRRGFGPAAAWRDSADSQAMAAGRMRSVSRTTWREVGLPIERWTEPLGYGLIAALNDVLHAGPTDEPGIDAAWHEAASRHGFADLDPAPVVSWLATRLGLADCQPAPRPTVTLLSSQKQPGHEPVQEWLVSGSARRIRWQFAAAALLALTTAGLFGRDAYREQVRNRAWQTLQNPASTLDALNGSEEFFSVGRPRLEPRERERAVWDIYAESIVRVLANSATGRTPETARHLARFADLAGRIPQPVSTPE